MLVDIAEAESARLPAAAAWLGKRAEGLMKAMDALNLRYGRDTVSVFSSLAPKPWAMRREAMSPCYTTRWARCAGRLFPLILRAGKQRSLKSLPYADSERHRPIPMVAGDTTASLPR